MPNDVFCITAPDAPAAGGHYSHAVIHQRLIYVSGQLPTVPGQREHRVGSIEEQARQALHNVATIVKSAGSSMDRVLSVTIYIADMALWAPVNAIYAEVMGEHRPARAIVPCGLLHYGYQIEIQAVAAL